MVPGWNTGQNKRISIEMKIAKRQSCSDCGEPFEENVVEIQDLAETKSTQDWQIDKPPYYHREIF